MDVSLSRPAVRVGSLGPPEPLEAIRSALGAAAVLQPATGESPSDVLLLVATAEQGVTEEVREQLRLSREVAPAPVVAFLDGCDRVSAEQGFVLDLIELELRGLAADLGLSGDGFTIVRSSPRQAPETHPLAAALANALPGQGVAFRMPIADLVPTRRGTVVLGRIESGRVRTGELVEITGPGRARTGRVRGVMLGSDLVPEGQAGEQVGLFLEKLRMTDFLGAEALVQAAPASLPMPPMPPAAVSSNAAGGGPATFVVPVFYATDRNLTAELTPRLVYGAGRGELTFGVAEVSLPRSRRRDDLPPPAWWRLESDEHLASHVVLLEVSVLDRQPFVAGLRRTVGLAAPPEALVYLHGYNVTFEDAARRTAELANDLDLPGVPVLYSWPSEGKAHRYTVDELNVEWTLPHFEELLRLVLAESGARTVHVVAEGMGNRALVRALSALDDLRPAGGARLREVVFAAPDIDRDTFLGLVPRFAKRAERFTLYASARDRALQAARIVHSHPRAGEPGGATAQAPGIDVIEVIETGEGMDAAFRKDLSARLRPVQA
jgi:esterase/lipase superfamily enzyme